MCRTCGPGPVSDFHVTYPPSNKGRVRYSCKRCKRLRDSDRDRKEYLRSYRSEIRQKVIFHYSQGRMACVSCEEDETVFLTIDHVRDDGFLFKGSSKRGGSGLYSFLIKEGFPDGFQVLCHNCNCSKSYRKSDSRHSEYRRRIRDEVFSAYAVNHSCACCRKSGTGILCLDHVNGGGNEERRAIGSNGGGHATYLWLKKRGFPSGYRVLCHNCNFAFGAHGQCPHLPVSDTHAD